MIEVKARFYRVEEKLPEKSGDYICVTSSGHFLKMSYSKKYNLFNATDDLDEDDARHWSIGCTYWADPENSELKQLVAAYEIDCTMVLKQKENKK